MAGFTGKVALVTGGSSGIGRAAALAFAREGARVAIGARGAERGEAVAREIRDAGGDALFVECDVSRGDDVRRLVERAVEAFGRLDFALNNAGAAERFAAVHDTDEEEFDRAVGVNLRGVWLCMREEIRRMLAQEPAGGAIVNTSSVNGLGGVAMAAPYAAAKAGVLALTKSAAQEYGARGIRVNALVAGAFHTPMLHGVWETLGGGDPEAAAGMEARYRELIPLGRVGQPEEAAAAALWLCSDAASYVTGHSLIVDGGMTSPFR